jgi:hypothetical protein
MMSLDCSQSQDNIDACSEVTSSEVTSIRHNDRFERSKRGTVEDEIQFTYMFPCPRRKQKPRYTPEEDRVISQGRAMNASWPEIAVHTPGRSFRDIRGRWFNTLNPSVNKSPWTPAEDQLLIQLEAEHGHRWSFLTKYFEGRPDSAVKNRYRKIRRNLGKVQQNPGSAEAVTIDRPEPTVIPTPVQPMILFTDPWPVPEFLPSLDLQEDLFFAETGSLSWSDSCLNDE